jgi:large subunit ribosomal protein L6
MKIGFEEQIGIPEGIEVKVDKGLVFVKGKNGEVSKKLQGQHISIEERDNNIVISSKKNTKREKMLIGTFKSHIKNMLKGVKDVYIYKLKICSTHFPMTASVSNNEFVLQNFLGEHVPRAFKIIKGVSVKIHGQEITVESPDKEQAGQTAASIEQLCRIADKDRRVFQDGIYIISKP